MKRSRILLTLFSALIIISLACNFTQQLPVPFAQPTATPMPLPAALVETDPPIGSQLGLNQKIIFYFNQPMDRASVVASLSGLPEGIVDWLDDSAMTFTPAVPYAAASGFSVQFNETAKAANGLALAAPVTASFTTTDYLRLTQSLPATDAVEVSPASAVVASFNQPVVPLGADPSTLPPAFTLEPAANGRGEWINTSTYAFYPEPAFSGGMSYVASLNPALVSNSAAPLESTQSWRFTTSLPQVVSIEPSTELAFPLDPEITITFNQPMDVASVQGNFAMLDAANNTVNGTFAWNEKNTAFTFKPAVMLARGADYTIFLSGNARSAGGAPLGSDLSPIVRTVGNFAVSGTTPLPGQYKNQYDSVALYFTAPLDSGLDYKDFITVTPPITNLGAGANDFELYIYGDWKPGTAYTVTLASRAADKYGQALGSPFSLSFFSADALPTLVFPYVNGDVYMVRPQNPVINAQAVNISGYSLALGAISLEEFFQLANSNNYDYRQGFSPDSVQTFSRDLSLQRNVSQPVDIGLTADGSALRTGFYHYQMRANGVDGTYTPPLLVSSDVNILLKVAPREALAWVTDLRTNAPLSGVEVRLYNIGGSQMASGVTNADGIWRIPLELTMGYDQVYYAITGQPGDANFGVGTSTWNSGIHPWNFGIPNDNSNQSAFMYLYTDRPIYRPGQVVYFKGVARQRFDGRYSEAAGQRVSLTLHGSSGEEVQTFDLPLSEFGTFDASFALPENALPGYYYFESEEYQQYLGFTVAEYRKPEINLSVTLTPDEAMAGAALQGLIDAQYYFGAAAGDLSVSWSLYARDEYVYMPGYQTGKVDTGWLAPYAYFGEFWSGYLGRTIASGEGKTGADGTLSLALTDLPASDVKQVYTLEASVMDESGLPVSARGAATIHPAQYYAGLAADSWIGQANQSLTFNLLTFDWSGKPAGSLPLTLEFFQVTWEREDINQYDVRFNPVYTPVSSSAVTTQADGTARQAFTPPAPGVYMLRASGRDVAVSEAMVWVGGREQAVYPSLVSSRIHLSADRDSYQSGDTARVFVPNPFGVESRALVTLERGSISRVEVTSIPAGGGSLSIPLDSKNEPNVFLSVTLMGGNSQFRQGYLNLVVEPKSLELNVEVTAPEQASPGEEVTLELRVTDADGKPVQAELSVAVADLAALALADPNAPGIVKAFYEIQPLQVVSGLTLANFASRDSIMPPGGGGGGGGGDMAIVREEFPDTALWQARVTTDANGKASLTLTLPDSLTTWQVDTRGLDKQTRVGEDTALVITSKDLIVRPVTPRFLVAGDRVELSAVVNNTTGESVNATVSLDAKGFKLETPETVKVEVPANGRASVSWTGSADDADSADLIFSVKAGNLQDSSRPANGALPILRYAAPQAFTTAGILASAGMLTELVSLPRSFIASSGSLDVELSPSLAASILGTLKALDLPRQVWSADQVVSYLLPNVATYATLKGSGISDADLDTELQANIQVAIQQLIRLENYDGGWGWQTGGQSDPYITAYALLGLQMARNSGFTVADFVIEQARNYFVNNQPILGSQNEDWELNRGAFIAYAMQLSGGVDPYVLETLYGVRDRLDPWAQAYLALALRGYDPNDARAGELLSNLQTTAIRTSTGVHWEASRAGYRNPGTPVYTSAVVVYALAQSDPATPLLADATRYLATHREASGKWGSGYETTWVLLALNSVMKGTGELNATFDYFATLNGATILTGSATGPTTLQPVTASQPLTSLNPLMPNALAFNRTEGPGRLYYRAALTVYRPVEQVAALNRGMTVSRTYYDASCKKDCIALKSAQLGTVDNIRVRVTLTLPNDAYYVNVEDYIPAGTEIFNTTLKTTQQGGGDGMDVTVQEYDDDDPYAFGWGWWLFGTPRIFDDHIAWSADYLSAGTYQLTYTITPLQAGQFRVIPARAWMEYFPEVQGTSAGTIFEIKK